jgi:transcriptional regulator with XRE-family HTH domain
MGHSKQKKMSYFSTALNRLAEKHGLKQADVVHETGLTRSHVSRIFSGDQKTVTDGDFVALVRVFSRDPRTQAELVVARCMDARIGPAADMVGIAIKSSARSASEKKKAEFPEVELSHETERAFAWLRSQCPLNPDLEKHLIGYAKLTGMK